MKFRFAALILVLLASVLLPGVGVVGMAAVPGLLHRPERGEWNDMNERFRMPGGRFARQHRLINGVEVPEAWVPFLTQDPSGFELVHTPLWFTRTFTDNATTVLNFFDAPLATDDLANAVFPYQNSYLLKALGLYIKNRIRVDDAAAAGAFPSQINDVQLLINTSVLDVTIGKKSYGPFPGWRLSAGGGAWGALAASGAEAANLVHDFGQVGPPGPDQIYKLAVPLVIPAQADARFRLRWPAGTVDLTGNADICLILEGIEARPKQ